MFYGLICLTWLDTISVVGTVLTLVLVELLKTQWSTENLTKTATTTITAPPTTLNLNKETNTPSTPTTPATPTTTTTLRKISTTLNGTLKKQKSEFKDDSLSYNSTTETTSTTTTPKTETPTTPSTPSTVTSQRHSISSFNNSGSHNSIPLTQQSSLSSNESLLSDEYHEDEDTLSLDNLFPCDQSEIYASKKISFIIDELIQTEMNYVNNLKKGLQNYGNLQAREDLPEALQGKDKQQQLLSNIDEILELHEAKILPLLLRHQRDLKTLFDEFSAYFDKDLFYAYVIFMMNKKASMQLRQEQREWFQTYQTEIKDKLGIDSFLVQPIQRLTRYPLLLQQFISEFYKSGISCKPVLMSVCKLETRMRRTLEVVNQAEEIPSIEEIHELNVMQQGHFRRATEFDAYNYRSRKKYRLKVLLFERSLACVEVRKKRLVYRQHFPWENIELKLSSSKSITILKKPADLVRAERKISTGTADGKQSVEDTSHETTTTATSSTATTTTAEEELELSSPEGISVTQWMKCARRIIEIARVEAAQRCRFSLPMDLVLGVACAIWLIWKYLY